MKNLRRPDFYRYSCDYELFGEPLKLYLDTGKRDQVLDLAFEWQGDEKIQNQFDQLGDLMKGRELGDIAIPDAKGGFPYAYFFYRRFVCELKDRFHIDAYQKNRDPLKLICRCFGVYEEDIHELIGRGVEVTSLRDLGDHLKAGIGCGSCHHDLKETLKPLISAPVEEAAPPQMSLWEKLDPQSLAKESHRLLKKWSESQGEGQSVELRGSRPGGLLLSLKGSGKWDKDNAGASLQEVFSKELGPGLDLVFV